MSEQDQRPGAGKLDSGVVSALEKHVRHSASYHRHWSGYTEQVIRDERGRQRIKRVYTGATYIQDLPPAKKLALRAAHTLCCAGSAALFISSATLREGSNRVRLVELITFLSLCALLMLGVHLAIYLFSPQRMTINRYRTGPIRLTQWSFVAALSLVVQTLALALGALQGDAGFTPGTLRAIALCGAAAPPAALVFLVEKRVSYTQSPAAGADESQVEGVYIDA